MGTIHDFLRPIDLMYNESTKGDQRSFREYGYDEREKRARSPYDNLDLRRNGIEPKLRPSGTPWRRSFTGHRMSYKSSSGIRVTQFT